MIKGLLWFLLSVFLINEIRFWCVSSNDRAEKSEAEFLFSFPFHWFSSHFLFSFCPLAFLMCFWCFVCSSYLLSSPFSFPISALFSARIPSGQTETESISSFMCLRSFIETKISDRTVCKSLCVWARTCVCVCVCARSEAVYLMKTENKLLKCVCVELDSLLFLCFLFSQHSECCFQYFRSQLNTSKTNPGTDRRCGFS